MPGKRVTIGGVSFDAYTEEHVVTHVRSALGRGEGGWILTPNVDILYQLRRDSDARAVLDETSIVVADGMPVVWASRLAGTPLPQRVCGADLIWSLSRGLAEDGRSVFILGGEPAAPVGAAHAGGAQTTVGPDGVRLRPAIPTPSARLPTAPRAEDEPGLEAITTGPVAVALRRNTGPQHAGPQHAGPQQAWPQHAGPQQAWPQHAGPQHAGPPQARSGPRREVTRPINETRAWNRDPRANTRDGAGRAATRLTDECPGLRVAGAVSPPYGFDRDAAALDAIRAELVAAQPDLVLVGIGFPRQERLIASLRGLLPGTWFLGCGMAIGFVAGEQSRAPMWMRRSGVEWMHRLASEPRRLADRYLRRDLPFAMSLLRGAAVTRLRRGERHAGVHATPAEPDQARPDQARPDQARPA